MAQKAGLTKARVYRLESYPMRPPYAYTLTLWWMCRYAVEIGKADANTFRAILEEKDDCYAGKKDGDPLY